MCFSCGKAGHSATRCPTLDESFPFMLPGWTAENTAGGYAMISPRSVAERKTATDPGEGGGITVPREGVAAWTRAPPLSTRAVPQSIPARVSVVLHVCFFDVMAYLLTL